MLTITLQGNLNYWVGAQMHYSLCFHEICEKREQQPGKPVMIRSQPASPAHKTSFSFRMSGICCIHQFKPGSLQAGCGTARPASVEKHHQELPHPLVALAVVSQRQWVGISQQTSGQQGMAWGCGPVLYGPAEGASGAFVWLLFYSWCVLWKCNKNRGCILMGNPYLTVIEVCFLSTYHFY